MNTYMRSAINSRDVRSAYNLLNEYRLLGKGLMDTEEHGRVVELAEHIKSYGQVAFHSDMHFILETAAYDLGALVREAYLAGSQEHHALVDIFLDVDREPRGEVQEASLRGVRKAQVQAATFFLSQGEEKIARRIFRDMRSEDPDRLEGIRQEMAATHDPEYWEISDRGANFDYLPPEQHRYLSTFFN
jgi:hypothetical protein